MHACERVRGDLCVCLLGVLVCIHLFMCAICLVCASKRERERERDGVLAMESNDAVVFDHTIPYICCSIGSWTASTAHNNDNMFHMNPTPHHCQHLATDANPAAWICKVYIFWLVLVWSQWKKGQDKMFTVASLRKAFFWETVKGMQQLNSSLRCKLLFVAVRILVIYCTVCQQRLSYQLSLNCSA